MGEVANITKELFEFTNIEMKDEGRRIPYGKEVRFW
jgi:hypothetical protein